MRPTALLLSSIALLLLLCTCGPAQAPHGEMDHADTDDHHGEEGIHLSPRQLEVMEIRFGEAEQLQLHDYVAATGSLGLPPNAYTAVSARASGFLRGARNYVEGDYIRRGATIALLESPEFIEHQRAYLEAAAELVFLRQELERQEELLSRDAGILKEVQRLRSQVAARAANVSGIGERLRYLGIDPATLTPDNIVKRITVAAPRSGYITQIALHEGMYAQPGTELLEIVDEQHLHLELDVFESDIAQVKKGQRVTYTVPALGDRAYTAEVHVIGREFNPANKTVRVHAHLTGDQPPFIRDLFAKARLWLSNQTVTALPEAAVLRDGDLQFVYAGRPDGDEVTFERIGVRTGVSGRGYVAVTLTDSLPPDMRLVTEGAYYVHAQAQAGELAHDH